MLTILLAVLQPLVVAVNWLANGVLSLLRLSPAGTDRDALSREELRTVVAEAGALIPRRHRQMLMGVLDLEKVTVEDIMIPRQEINAIDLEDSPSEILEQITHAQHTRMPLFRGDINEIEGFSTCAACSRHRTKTSLSSTSGAKRSSPTSYPRARR